MTIGLDTNILCYALEPEYPEHACLKNMLLSLSPDNIVALNSTVIHETYHVLVFYLQWLPEEAAKRLSMLLKNPYVAFFNQTRTISQIALSLAVKLNIDGRDALILANYLTNKVPKIYTHDEKLLKLLEISWKSHVLSFKDPLEKE